MSNLPQAQTIQPLDPLKVRVALAQRGWTQARLATELGRSLTTVSLTINHHTYPAVAVEIRKLLELE
jgi:hypothetical protein